MPSAYDIKHDTNKTTIKAMTNLRFNVVESAFKKKPLEVITPAERPAEYFGKYVFNRSKMYKYLPPQVGPRRTE